MYIITEKQTNEVLRMGLKLDTMDNGYPRLVEENVAFPPEVVNVYEVETIPDNLEPYKYCYTEEKGFYPNPNWVEPDSTNTYGIPDEVYHAIIDDYTAEIFGGEV